MSETPPANNSAWSRLIGTRSDWQIRAVRPRRPRIGLHWVGPLAVVGSLGWSWWAFDGAIGEEGSAALGLYTGAVSILLMAWSFVLAVRFKFLEPFFGGLDSMYRGHRWAGSLAIVAMFLHTRLEPEVENGFLGASESIADTAQGLAGVAEITLYILVGASLLRWIPYRFWRLTHKLLGIPFVFACWHFFTAEKPYANSSGWGWWFGTAMVVGVFAYLLRVVGRDVVSPGFTYQVAEATRRGSTLEMALSPTGSALRHEAGQFAVIKVQVAGLGEPHMFTIASAPGDGRLRFFIRDLGDWTAKLHQTELSGVQVVVEGPYGTFKPLGDPAQRTVWIAGGVGISPFLSAIESLGVSERLRPTLFYAVRSAADAMAVDVLREAQAEGLLDLVLCSSSEGNRFSQASMARHFDGESLRYAHVAVCGPSGLVAAAHTAATSLGARHVEREDFDIRQGFGPDLSRDVDCLWVRLTNR